MARRVYRYRRAATLPVPGCLASWSLAFTFALVRHRLFGPLPGGVQTSAAQTAALFPFGLSIGLGVGALAARLVLGWARERVEIEGEEVRRFDWRGRMRVSAPLTTIQSVREGTGFMRPLWPPLSPSYARIWIKTPCGEIPAHETVIGFEELRERACAAWRENVERRPKPP